MEVVPFNRVGADYACLEGDGSLADWRRTHWAYYERVLDGTEHTPDPRMPIVCEQFEVVFTRSPFAPEQYSS